jgi:hypothetical protein
VNTVYYLEEWRGEKRISSPGDIFTPREQNSPFGTTPPLVSKFAPRGEVKNGPQFYLSKVECYFVAPGPRDGNFFGIFLGYFIGRVVVNNGKRFAIWVDPLFVIWVDPLFVTWVEPLDVPFDVIWIKPLVVIWVEPLVVPMVVPLVMPLVVLVVPLVVPMVVPWVVPWVEPLAWFVAVVVAVV